VSFPGKGSSPRPLQTPQVAWQREVWTLFDEVGEFQYGLNWVANVCSRARLLAAHRNPDGSVEPYPLDSPQAKALAYLSGGIEGQPILIKQMALHLGAVGECYLVDRATIHEDDPLGKNVHVKGGRMWEVVGTEEIGVHGSSWWIEYEGGNKVYLTAADTVIRVWQRHPRQRMRAHSSSKAALPILREIRRLDAHIEAQTDSRLTGSGLLFMPSEMGLKPPPGQNASLTSADIVVNMLVEAAGAHKKGIGTAEAQVPIVFTAPGDVLKNVKHIQLWSPLDEKAITMRDNSLGRLARTMDMPQEIVLGTSDMNRWGAWQVEESSVKANIEPLLTVMCHAFTTEYLQIVTGDKDDVVIFDTSTLRLRPNRSKEAIELYDRGQLSGEALLRETGFNGEDAPKDDERKQWLLMQMVRASWSPEQAGAAARALGVDVGLGDSEPREARPTPSLKDHPTRDAPEKSVSDGTAGPPTEAAVAAMLAHRAMERAGNRLRTITGQKPDRTAENTHMSITVFPERAHDLLRDSFDGCAAFGLSEAMVKKVERLCRDYLVRGREFTYADALRRLSE